MATNEEIEWWEYDDTDEMADAVAGDVGFIIESAIEARGGAVIALAGGKTPVPIYAKLAKAKLEWKRVTIIPGDERIVPLGDPLSNVTMIAKTFLPLGARVMPVVPQATEDYKAAGRSADALMQDLHWPLDLCLLGIGADGHTASIFPGPDFDEALNGPKERRMLGGGRNGVRDARRRSCGSAGQDDAASFSATLPGRCSWNELVTSDQKAALPFYSSLLGWSSISMIFSTPPAPIITGTPTYRPSTPYWPST